MKLFISTNVPEECLDLIEIELFVDGFIRDFQNFGNYAIAEVEDVKNVEVVIKVGRRRVAWYKGAVKDVIHVSLPKGVLEGLMTICQSSTTS